MFKLNSNKTVMAQNKDLILPKLDTPEWKGLIASVSFTPEEKIKLDQLRAKYKISRSAIIRILINQAS